MTKRILFSLFALVLMVACNTNSEEAIEITTAEFSEQAAEMVDQKVTFEGTVMHVCKHGGKKMFINEDRVKIVVSEHLAAFDQTLEGSEVVITGVIIEEMAAPVLSEDTDMKHKEGEETEHSEGDDPTEEKEHVEGDNEVAAEDCDMEEIKPLYVVEIIKIAEKEN